MPRWQTRTSAACTMRRCCQCDGVLRGPAKLLSHAGLLRRQGRRAASSGSQAICTGQQLDIDTLLCVVAMSQPLSPDHALSVQFHHFVDTAVLLRATPISVAFTFAAKRRLHSDSFAAAAVPATLAICACAW